MLISKYDPSCENLFVSSNHHSFALYFVVVSLHNFVKWKNDWKMKLNHDNDSDAFAMYIDCDIKAMRY